MPTEMFEVLAHSAADPKAVFDVVADIPSWAQWAKPVVPRSVRERDGQPEPNGVGAVRKAGGFGFWVREEIVEFIPPVRLAYIITSGIPVRRYRATVEFEPAAAGGTTIRWRGQFEARIRGTGPLLNRAFRTVLGVVANKAAEAAR